MATPFHAEVVTPERVLFSGDADELSLRTDEGEIAFLAHHAEFVGAVEITVATLNALGTSNEEGGTAPAGEGGEASGAPLRFAVHGGFVHVADNAVTVLAGVAERGDEVDVARARAALESARERLAADGPPTAPDGSAVHTGDDSSADLQEGTPLTGAKLALLAPSSAAAALRRAEVRLEAAGAAGDGA